MCWNLDSKLLYPIIPSQLVENYLGNLVKTELPDIYSPRVQKLSGVVKLPKGFDEKKEYKKYLVSKYGKIWLLPANPADFGYLQVPIY